MQRSVLVLATLVLAGAVVLFGWRFNRDMALARAHAAQGEVLLPTRCGPIEYQESGTGVPLLVVHGTLILLVPLAYKPATEADSAPPMPAWVEATMMRLIGSDFLFWAALHLARDQVIKVVLATPPELLAASLKERARVNAMLDNILPVSARAKGLRTDSSVGKHLAPSSLESINVPTLIVCARDDRYGTYASAQHSTSRIAGAKFVDFDRGGHTLVGHDDEVMAEIVKLLDPSVRP